MSSTVRVTDVPERARYEASVDGRLAGFVQYRRAGGVLTLPHTEVDPAFGGSGVGTTLVRRALDDVRARGERVRPVCPFVATFIERHPEYQDLLVQPQG